LTSVITKKCKECDQLKYVNAFYKTSGCTCKECVKRLQRTRYSQNRRLLQGRTKQSLRKRLDKLYQYLQRHPCVDCGCTDIAVLRNTSPWLIVEAEIAKCDIVCINCHLKRTA